MRILAAIVALTTACMPGVAMGQTKQGPPSFDNARFPEDYSYLLDPANRTGAWWEPLKAIPLDPDGVRYVTFGADMRARFEGYLNNQWGSAPAPDNGYGLFRVMPYADVHLGPNLRMFAHLIGAWAPGIKPEPGPADETDFDLMQSFVQVRYPSDTGALTLQGGRQLMAYGSQRLIALRFGPNVPQPFDGGLARLETGLLRTDAFYVRPVETRPANFNDRTDDTSELWSLYSTLKLPAVSPTSGLDAFYIGYTNTQAVYEQGSGDELRQTLGSRYFGGRGNWKWDYEAHFQFGTFGSADILAWSVATDTTYTWASLPLRPYFELRAGAISGDRNPNDNQLNSFNAMFPRGKYFGEIGLLGPRNLINLHPIVGVDLGEGWYLRGATVFFWRESLGDGIYDNPGNLLRASDSSRARYIGTQAEVVLGREVTRGLTIEGAYSFFEPGPFIEQTGPAKEVHFVGVEVQLRF
jgi:Alginate export